jgi:L-alanine-DL-glutamate epimerase-like enolase superfamily enzyme
MKLNSVEFASVSVTDRTTWTHALFTDADGVEAQVEITSGESTQDIAVRIGELHAGLRRRKVVSEADIVPMLGLEEASLRADRSLGTAVSALRTAVAQIDAKRRGVSLTESLGGTVRDSVELYANINRALFATDRSPWPSVRWPSGPLGPGSASSNARPSTRSNATGRRVRPSTWPSPVSSVWRR